MRKRILVTGGAGFIGSHFIALLLKQADIESVINIDKLTYAAIGDPKAWYQNDARYHFIHGDIANKSCIESCLAEYDIDTVVNFAAESHVDRSIESAGVFMQTNIIGTQVLLDAIRHSKPDCHFHQISTDEVFGDIEPSAKPVLESAPYQPSSPYSASKASADHLVRAYHRTYGIAVTISHCTNNYGPNQHAEKFVPTVLRAFAYNEKIPVYGDGMQIRDWLYVEDHCSAILSILKHGKIGESYNIAGMDEKTNLDIIKAIYQHFPRPLQPLANYLSFVDDRPGHDRRYALDISKIHQQLAWQPTTDFTTGLEKTIHHALEKIPALSKLHPA